jgi:hypothetical protein
MIDVPDALVADLPSLVAEFLDRWEMRPDGPTRHVVASLVLPVVRADGVPAALKFQPVDDENVGELVGLRVWRGDGAVRLFDHNPDTVTMLWERLHADRPLSSGAAAVQIVHSNHRKLRDGQGGGHRIHRLHRVQRGGRGSAGRQLAAGDGHAGVAGPRTSRSRTRRAQPVGEDAIRAALAAATR